METKRIERPKRGSTKRSPSEPLIGFLSYFDGDRYFTEQQVGRIIEAVGSLPEGKIRSKQWTEDGSLQCIVLVDRRDELARQLDLAFAALNWSDSRQDGPASIRQKQFESIQAAADRLLKSLKAAGFIRSEPSAECLSLPSDFLEAIALCLQKANLEEGVIPPDKSLGKCVQAVKALRNSAIAAKAASERSKTTGRSGFEARYKGDQPLQQFVHKLKAIYRAIWRKPAKTSRPQDGGPPTGPFLRFVSTCFSILRIDKTDEAIAHMTRPKRRVRNQVRQKCDLAI